MSDLVLDPGSVIELVVPAAAEFVVDAPPPGDEIHFVPIAGPPGQLPAVIDLGGPYDSNGA